MKERSLPLGIDIGTTRLRVAAATYGGEGPLVRTVIARDIPFNSPRDAGGRTDYIAALIGEAVADADTRERRCVSAVGEPQALLRAVHLPGSSRAERQRAALREAQRHIDYFIKNAALRIHPIPNREFLFALGVVRRAALQSRLLTLKKAGLKVVAVDHEGLALERAFPNSTAVIDIGHERTSVHYYGEAVPRTAHCPCGGAEITRAVGRELSLNNESAEKRKCTLGTLGAGDSARVALTLKLSHLFEEMAQERPRPQRITLVGNGSRLEGIAAELEQHTGVTVDTRMPRIMSSEAYCPQSWQASAADWSLAIGLSVWGMVADY